MTQHGFQPGLIRPVGWKPTPLPPMKIEISVPEQSLRLFDDDGALVREYACSTSKYGYSSVPESYHTPLGQFRIVEKIGHGAEPGTIFNAYPLPGVRLADAARSSHRRACVQGGTVQIWRDAASCAGGLD